MADQPRDPPWVESLTCSFCGKKRTDVEMIVCGPTPAVAICNECVELCAEIMEEQRAPARPEAPAA
jgi:ATP-dependent Clp protease ATP-binding subunit ClpX